MPLLALFLVVPLAACGDDDGGPALADAGTESGPDAATARPGLDLLDYHLAVDVTPDGRTAVFELLSDTDVRLVYLDTATATGRDVGSVGDPSRDLVTGVAQSGRVSALHLPVVQAAVFDESTGWTDLPSPHAAGCDQDVGGAFDVSADGHSVVGLAWNGCTPDAVLWSDAAGAFTARVLDVLGEPFPDGTAPPVNRATVISDDGSTVAGFAQLGNVDRSPALWHADGTGEMLDPEATDTPGEVLAIDATGATLAGIRGTEGFVWTRAGGFVDLVRLDSALPSDPVFPNALTADGRFVFGGVGDAFTGVPVAFVWDEAGGMRSLVDVARAAGVAIADGVLLNSVLGASADGLVLIGTAMDAAGAPKTFVLRLPPGAL